MADVVPPPDGMLDAAAKRYLRALKRLKEILAQMPGGLTGLRQ